MMALEDIMLSEISQTGKDNYLLISLIRGIQKGNKQNKMKTLMKKKEKRMIARREGGL